MKRTKRSELLVGVTSALYTNWLIAIGEKMDATTLTNGAFFFILSLILFLMYFREAFKNLEEQTWVKILPLKTFLGSAHIMLVETGLILEGIFQNNYIFSSIGFFLWVMVMQVERQEVA
jgi:CDP-diglyceride synthetase